MCFLEVGVDVEIIDVGAGAFVVFDVGLRLIVAVAASAVLQRYDEGADHACELHQRVAGGFATFIGKHSGLACYFGEYHAFADCCFRDFQVVLELGFVARRAFGDVQPDGVCRVAEAFGKLFLSLGGGFLEVGHNPLAVVDGFAVDAQVFETVKTCGAFVWFHSKGVFKVII